jgi:integrase
VEECGRLTADEGPRLGSAPVASHVAHPRGGGGDRQRAAGARTGRRHPAREEREIHRRARRQLAIAQAGANAPERAGHYDAQVKGLRDRAIIAVLLGCALRRSEVAALTMAHVQQRDGRWCIVDLYGKHGRVRTIPMPAWVKVVIEAWTGPAGVVDGYVFRPVIRGDQVRGDVLSEKVVWQLLRPYAAAAGVPGIAPHDCRRTAAKLCRAAGGELEQIQLLLGHASVQTTERYLGTKQDLVHAPNDGIKLRVAV